ncbi:hypothetical protein C492_06970 [Natronococcus jeotgali DSM 18795]|uniref:Uncharacterized protein n=16 Tax=Halobacteriales TaxID=2235 RepID=M0C0V8_9EURY|nr:MULTISPECIES: hypothetical protein [Haloferax]ELY63770.1 hypothetical protein C492_06970 [Natronococcus jeotgali DSM 18795]ELY92879.1 hypothetical protein C484_08148 [Natrialba taiwanensis DSM 12281]ELZ16313.1 hypothetical protein C476_17097 [Natrinema limicola JCM 13563]ELZ90000.1 hypothetical protein C452_11063 [Haloferax alexandrinus JCM 10717]
MEFDPADAGFTVALMVAGFIQTGIATFQLFDINFTDVIFSSGNIEITLAYAVSVGAFAGIIITNENTDLSSLKDDAEKLDDYYMWSIFGTVGVFAAWLLVGDVSSFFQSSDLWGLVYVGITSTAGFAAGWML